MTLANLIRVAPPPAAPFWAFRGPWGAIESELGTALPQDYKEFIAAYGGGEFMEFLRVFLPKSWTRNLRLGAQVKIVADASREVFKDDEDNLPYPLWPDPGGLLVFGLTGGGDYMFWLTRGAPQDWPVVVWDGGSEDTEFYPCDMTDFLAGVSTGAFFSDVMGAEEVYARNRFEPYTVEDVRRALEDPYATADLPRAWRLAWSQVAHGAWGYIAKDPFRNSD